MALSNDHSCTFLEQSCMLFLKKQISSLFYHGFLCYNYGVGHHWWSDLRKNANFERDHPMTIHVHFGFSQIKDKAFIHHPLALGFYVKRYEEDLAVSVYLLFQVQYIWDRWDLQNHQT